MGAGRPLLHAVLQLAGHKKTADSQPRFGFPFADPIEALPVGVAMGTSTQDLETSFFLRTQPATPQTTS